VAEVDISEPPKLDRCVAKVKKQARKDHPDWDEKRINDYAWAVCVKSTGLSPHEDEEETNEADVSLNEIILPAKVVEIREAEPEEEKLGYKYLVKATAVSAGKSSNYNWYKEEELERSYKSLIGAPFLKDHNVGMDSLVGRVVDVGFSDGKIHAIINVVDDATIEKIKYGVATDVSIAARANLICSICGEEFSNCSHIKGRKYNGNVCYAIPTNIKFGELSAVVAGGVADAKLHPNETPSLEMAGKLFLMESTQLKDDSDSINEEKVRKMEEEEKAMDLTELAKRLAEMEKTLEEERRLREEAEKALEDAEARLNEIREKERLEKLEMVKSLFEGFEVEMSLPDDTELVVLEFLLEHLEPIKKKFDELRERMMESEPATEPIIIEKDPEPKGELVEPPKVKSKYWDKESGEIRIEF